MFTHPASAWRVWGNKTSSGVSEVGDDRGREGVRSPKGGRLLLLEAGHCLNDL